MQRQAPSHPYSAEYQHWTVFGAQITNQVTWRRGVGETASCDCQWDKVGKKYLEWGYQTPLLCRRQLLGGGGELVDGDELLNGGRRPVLKGFPFSYSQVIGGGRRHCLEVSRLRIVDVRGNFHREVVRRVSQSVTDKGFREKTVGTKIEDHYLVIEQLKVAVAGVDTSIDGAKVKPFVLKADILISIVSKDLSRP